MAPSCNWCMCVWVWVCGCAHARTCVFELPHLTDLICRTLLHTKAIKYNSTTNSLAHSTSHSKLKQFNMKGSTHQSPAV